MEEQKKDVLILAIETSCDETAAAVVKNGREVLSNTIYTQIKLHTMFGGVVPIKSPVPFLQKPISYYSYFTITGRSPQPLCYFLVRK